MFDWKMGKRKGGIGTEKYTRTYSMATKTSQMLKQSTSYLTIESKSLYWIDCPWLFYFKAWYNFVAADRLSGWTEKQRIKLGKINLFQKDYVKQGFQNFFF